MEAALYGIAAFMDSTVALFNGLVAAGGAMFDFLAERPGDVGQLMLKGFRDAIEAIIDFFGAMAQTIGSILGGLAEDAVTVIANIGGAAGAVASGSLEAAGTFSDNIKTAMLRSANRVATFAGTFEGHMTKLKNTELLPEVEISKDAAQLGATVAQEFRRGVRSTPSSAQDALAGLLGSDSGSIGAAANNLGQQAGGSRGTAYDSEGQTEHNANLAGTNRLLEEQDGLHQRNAQSALDLKIRSLDASTNMADGFHRAFLKMKREAEDLAAVGEAIVNAFANRATDAIIKFVETGEFKFKEFAQALLKDLLRIIIRLLVVKALSAAFGGGDTGAGAANAGAGAQNLGGAQGMQEGGTVQPGRSYMVGENGPELFTPGRTGSITPNAADQPQAPPQVNVQVVNVDDPQMVPQAISAGEADDAIVNTIMRNKDRIRQAVQ
jgi:hypothetical protein